MDANKQKTETGRENRKNINRRGKGKELERKEESSGKQKTGKKEKSPTATSREDSSVLRSIIEGSDEEGSAKEEDEGKKE